MSESKDKQARKEDINKGLQDKLNSISDPLVNALVDLNKKCEGNTQHESLSNYLDNVSQLFIVAIWEGVKLSTAFNEDMDKALKKVIDIAPEKSCIAESMQRHSELKKAASDLNMGSLPLSDGSPRFVTPDEFDPITGDYKGNKQ